MNDQLYSSGQKFMTTFLSTTVPGVTKWNPSDLPELRTTFYADAGFQCCFFFKFLHHFAMTSQ